MADLFRAIRTASAMTDSVIVAFSGGKDALVTLDLCSKHFGRVEAFFMYHVPGLAFQEAVLRSVEARYGIKIHRVPMWELAALFKYGNFCGMDYDIPLVTWRNLCDYVRTKTGIWWIAGGEKRSDYFQRSLEIKKRGCVSREDGRFFPLAEWRDKDVVAYLKQNRLRMANEYALVGNGLSNPFFPERLAKIKELHPEDYARIERWFPLIGASLRRIEYGEQDQAPDRRNKGGRARFNPRR